MHDEKPGMISVDKVVATLRALAYIYLPLFGFVYYLATLIWPWEYSEELLGIIFGVDLLLGLYLAWSKNAYDGDIEVENVEDGPLLYSLNLNGDPSDLEYKKIAIFKIRRS